MTGFRVPELTVSLAIAALAAVAALGAGCSGSETDSAGTATTDAASTGADEASVAERLEGRYAHYDVVAYEATDMKTLIISYGFTDLALDGAKLMATESFCHAEHRSDQDIETTISDAATSAIKPRSVEVDLGSEGGRTTLHRPETPTGIGIDLADPANDELPTDPEDPRIADDDNDGHPGITVHIKVSDEVQGDLYIARRERFSYDLDIADADTVDPQTLTGTVTDNSEQLIIGASNPIFITEEPWTQLPDLSKSPIILKKVDPSWDCERLAEERGALFPETPTVDW